MNENDKKLIDEAWNINYIQWHSIESLIEKADSEDDKEKLRKIMKYKYHIEEYRNGGDRWDV